jgi:hypothetical protein
MLGSEAGRMIRSTDYGDFLLVHPPTLDHKWFLSNLFSNTSIAIDPMSFKLIVKT